VFAPSEDPDNPQPGKKASRDKGPIESDRRCPWCGSDQLAYHKQMPDPYGPGILAYVFFPIALMMWLTRTGYNICGGCGQRWQRGVRIEREVSSSMAPPPEQRAGMYAEQVPAAALVRRRARLGQDSQVTQEGEVELRVAAGSCRICRQAGGRYDARDAPSVPVVGCVCEGGCRCEIVRAD